MRIYHLYLKRSSDTQMSLSLINPRYSAFNFRTSSHNNYRR